MTPLKHFLLKTGNMVKTPYLYVLSTASLRTDETLNFDSYTTTKIVCILYLLKFLLQSAILSLLAILDVI